MVFVEGEMNYKEGSKALDQPTTGGKDNEGRHNNNLQVPWDQDDVILQTGCLAKVSGAI